MAERFVEVDRNTPMLLPADLRDWVPEDDLVHFVIEAVKTLPTGEFVVNERGTGYAQYPPSMMLALLIYGYANGIFSSRRIERATYRDLGVRFLTGDTHPDHDTICSFRRQNEKLIAKFFVRVLELARELKLFAGGHHQRQASVEPVVGIIKKVLGFEQFSLRGLQKVTLEWTLVCVAYNLKRLHKLRNPPKEKPKAPKTPRPTSPALGELLDQLFARYCLAFQ